MYSILYLRLFYFLPGDLMFVMLLAYKGYVANISPEIPASLYYDTTTNSLTTTSCDTTANSSKAEDNINEDKYEAILPDYLQLPEKYNMKDLLFYIAVATSTTLLMFHFVCGFLQLYYYTLRRDEPETWKCQPHRFLTRSNEIHEIVVGTVNMTLGGCTSGVLTCWIANGNYSTIYFKIDEYGYPYLFISLIVIFLWIEATTYYFHAFLHWPWVYKNFHKHHHRYHSPTAYSVVAMSPCEMFVLQGLVAVPLFVVPVNAFVQVNIIIGMGNIKPLSTSDYHKYLYGEFNTRC